MALPEHLADLTTLETLLGDPFDEQNPLSYKNIMALDEREETPQAALDYLQKHRVFDYLVPESLGGRLHSYQHLYHIIRMISRRDVTLATFFVLRAIGLGPMLIDGTDEQKRYYAAQILEGCGISWGVSEREHGSDLINTGTIAHKEQEHYVLNGSKWLIGALSTAEMSIFLAKSAQNASPDSFTLFCIDSREHNDKEFQRLPRERLHGVRGLDLSGATLKDCRVPSNHIIGREGTGLELMLRTAQMHRVGAVTMALGAMDTGLRIAMSFADMRHIFGQKLSEIPITRSELVDTFCELIMCEVVTSAATRALHFAPKQMFLLAAVSKYLVPTFSREGFARMAGAIGARYYLRENFAYGLFQKAMRDAEMTSFVDGNEKVNLKNISLHMEVTLPYTKKGKTLSEQDYEDFTQFFNLNCREPDARFSDLVIFTGRKDYGLMMLNDSIERLRNTLANTDMDAQLRDDINREASAVGVALDRLYEEMLEQKNSLGKQYNYSPQSYDLARKYALLHGAASCIHVAVYTEIHGSMADLSWLPLCLHAVQKRLGYEGGYPEARWIEGTFASMQEMFDEGLAFSLLSLPIAEAPRAFCDNTLLNI